VSFRAYLLIIYKEMRVFLCLPKTYFLCPDYAIFTFIVFE